MRKILIIISTLFIINLHSQDILPLKERATFIKKVRNIITRKFLKDSEKSSVYMTIQDIFPIDSRIINFKIRNLKINSFCVYIFNKFFVFAICLKINY